MARAATVDLRPAGQGGPGPPPHELDRRPNPRSGMRLGHHRHGARCLGAYPPALGVVLHPLAWCALLGVRRRHGLDGLDRSPRPRCPPSWRGRAGWLRPRPGRSGRVSGERGRRRDMAHPLRGRGRIEAQFSPTHIGLFLGALLIFTTPLRAAWSSSEPGPAPTMRAFLPALLALAWTTLLVQFLFLYVSAFRDDAPSLAPGRPGAILGHHPGVPGDRQGPRPGQRAGDKSLAAGSGAAPAPALASTVRRRHPVVRHGGGPGGRRGRVRPLGGGGRRPGRWAGRRLADRPLGAMAEPDPGPPGGGDRHPAGAVGLILPRRPAAVGDRLAGGALGRLGRLRRLGRVALSLLMVPPPAPPPPGGPEEA